MMRRLLKAYIAAIIGGAAVMLLVDLSRLPSSPLCLVVGGGGCARRVERGRAVHAIQVARGWYSTAGAVPAVAAALLLPPGLALLVSVVGSATRVIRVRQAP